MSGAPVTRFQAWEVFRTADSDLVERTLCGAGFSQVAAYRYNPASLRVRVIDPRFEGLSRSQRADMLEPTIKTLPERLQVDIVRCWLFTPAEAPTSSEACEFESVEVIE